MLYSYLAKPFSLCVLLETESGEVNTRAEHPGFGQDTDTADTVNLHLHVWVAIGVAEVGQMRSPCSILCVSFDNDSILIESIS